MSTGNHLPIGMRRRFMIIVSIVIVFGSLAFGAHQRGLIGGYTDSGGWVHDWDGNVYPSDVLLIQVDPGAASDTVPNFNAEFGTQVMSTPAPGFYFIRTKTHDRSSLWHL